MKVRKKEMIKREKFLMTFNKKPEKGIECAYKLGIVKLINSLII